MIIAQRAIEKLIAAAVRAPSGDNLQPWQFEVDPDTSRIAIYVDQTRDRSPMNAGQRASRLAVGAALENILRSADSRGWSTHVEEGPKGAVAAVRLVRFDGDGDEGPAITQRVTNRRVYDGRPVAPEVLDALQEKTPQLEGIRTHWISSPTRLARLAELIGRADALMFGEPSMRGAFLENLRFDRPWDDEVDEGLSLASLDVSGVERLALRLMRYIPDRVLNLGGITRKFATVARKLVQSASGLCLIVQEELTGELDVVGGRAMQRAWLALTDKGLAAQPMMSLPIFENALHFGTPELLASLGRERTESMVAEFRDLASEIGAGYSAVLLRFGYAPPPTARTGRRPLSAVISTESVPSPAS